MGSGHRKGDGSSEARLVEAKEDLQLGLQADGDAPENEPVGEAERRADAASLPPVLHPVGPCENAAGNDDAEGDAGEAACRSSETGALLALFSIDKVEIGFAAQLALGAGKLSVAVPVAARRSPANAALLAR